MMWLSLVPSRTSRPGDPGSSGGAPVPDPPVYGLGRIGMWLFFASLTTFFSPLLLIYAILRTRYPIWPPAGLVLPRTGFLVATAMLIAVSVSMALAVRCIQADQRIAFRRWIIAAAIFAVAFVAAQIVNWMVMFEGRVLIETWSAAGFLYFFTAIHALHVIGGIVPLIFIALRAARNRYTRFRHTGVRFVGMYWHFIDAVWLVMLAAFFIP